MGMCTVNVVPAPGCDFRSKRPPANITRSWTTYQPPGSPHRLGPEHLVGVKALAVVLGCQAYLGWPVFQADDRVIGPGVPGDVAEALLGDAEQHSLNVRRQAASVAADLNGHFRGQVLLIMLGIRAQRRHQPEIIQERGPQVGHQLPQLIEGPHA